MPTISKNIDIATVEWRKVTDPSFNKFKVDFEYSLLGYDLNSGRLDMLIKYAKFGHCRPHRHIASTTTIVLEGDQYLNEFLPNGDVRKLHRKKGDYVLSSRDANPHDEFGGENGGTVLLSMTSFKGLLFEYFDDESKNKWTVSLREYIDNWNAGIVYGCNKPKTKKVINY